MRATLNYRLPQDQDEFTWATKGRDYIDFIYEYGQLLRKKWKYDDTLEGKSYELIEDLREEFYRLLEEHGINLDREYN
jgi:hypothetical protein